jgi:hypothetical protein
MGVSNGRTWVLWLLHLLLHLLTAVAPGFQLLAARSFVVGARYCPAAACPGRSQPAALLCLCAVPRRPAERSGGSTNPLWLPAAN